MIVVVFISVLLPGCYQPLAVKGMTVSSLGISISFLHTKREKREDGMKRLHSNAHVGRPLHLSWKLDLTVSTCDRLFPVEDIRRRGRRSPGSFSPNTSPGLHLSVQWIGNLLKPRCQDMLFLWTQIHFSLCRSGNGRKGTINNTRGGKLLQGLLNPRSQVFYTPAFK